MGPRYDVNKPFWRSKKWWMAIIAAFVPLLNHLFGWQLDVAEITAIVMPFVAYVIGQSLVDANH